MSGFPDDIMVSINKVCVFQRNKIFTISFHLRIIKGTKIAASPWGFGNIPQECIYSISERDMKSESLTT